MRHFHRSHLPPDDVLYIADEFFRSLGLAAGPASARERSYAGPLGALTLRVRSEGGHYTLVEVETDQVGESRLDRNVKRFFVRVHRADVPTHQLLAAY